jgi:hypothetical protein
MVVKLPDFDINPEIENLAIKIIETVGAMEQVGDMDLLFKLRKAGRISSIHSYKSGDSVKKYFAKLVKIGFLQPVGNTKARFYRFADFD